MKELLGRLTSDAFDLSASLEILERETQARIGVSVLDTGSSRVFAFRGKKRFSLCSTFKVFVAATVLNKVDANQHSLNDRIHFNKLEITRSGYAPVVKKDLNEGDQHQKIQIQFQWSLLFADIWFS